MHVFSLCEISFLVNPYIIRRNQFRWIWEYREANEENEADQASGTVYPIDEIGEVWMLLWSLK